MSKALLVWIGLPLFLCTALFHMKHEVQLLEEKIQSIKIEISATKESIDVIQAEWGHLTNPQRLADINQRFLKLSPTEPKQLIQLSDLPKNSSPLSNSKLEPNLAKFIVR